MTAKPAQPTNAPRPWAVIIAYQKLSPTRASRHGLAPAQEHAEQARGGEDQRRGLQVAGRQAAGDLQGALVAHAGFTTNVDFIR